MSQLVEKEQQILLKYTLLESQSQIRLRLKPFLAFRNHHSLSKSNLYANTKVRKVSNGIMSRMYEGYPGLYMQLSKENDFVHVPDWYYNIEYMREMERGYDYKEDLFVPGYFEVSMRKGESLVFSAGTKEASPQALKRKYSNEYMSQLYKHAKIYPVDANPGLLNGIHLRIFDCLEHGVLPIPEYRKDIKEVFRNTGLPIISNYNKAREITQYYLIHDQERKELIKSLKSFVRGRYNPPKTVERIMEKLK